MILARQLIKLFSLTFQKIQCVLLAKNFPTNYPRTFSNNYLEHVALGKQHAFELLENYFDYQCPRVITTVNSPEGCYQCNVNLIICFQSLGHKLPNFIGF